MRTILTLFILFGTYTCTSQKKQHNQNIEEVIYHTQTRGAMEKISIKHNYLVYKTYNNSKTYKLTQTQKHQLLSLINKIKLNEISNFKAPTNERASDRVMHATLSIKTKSLTYVSTTFDYGNPPLELKEIIILIKSYIK